MLPLRDTIRSNTFPLVNYAIIALNAIVFLFEISLSPSQLDQFILHYGLIPARIPLMHPTLLLLHPLLIIPLFTHMWLHGGWLHILSNMWVLYIFGDNVEDRMGSGRYLLFYLISGLVAGSAQILIDPTSQVPSIGASGAIAGVLGAYFILYPRARVTTLILIIIIPLFIDLPAIIFLGFWFVTQLFSGVTSIGGPAAAGGIAWWAHIGGFLFGAIFFRLFIPRRHPAYSRQYPDEYWPW